MTRETNLTALAGLILAVLVFAFTSSLIYTLLTLAGAVWWWWALIAEVAVRRWWATWTANETKTPAAD